jgi:hypothetical protein
MNKKGFFFTLDAIMALTILAVGMFLVLSMLLVSPQKTQTEIIARDTMEFLSTSTIENLNDPIAGIGGEMWEEGNITNEKNTLLQQIGEFYSKQKIDSAERFISAILNISVPNNHYAEVFANDERIYPSIEPDTMVASKDSTPLLIAKEEIAYGIINTTTFDLWGPIDIRLLVWQR